MMRWPLNPDNEALNEFIFAKCFRELKLEERVTLLQSYLYIKFDVPNDNVVIQSNLFPETSQKFVSMISTILGKNNDSIVDEFVLGIMVSICPITTKPISRFNYAQSWQIKSIINSLNLNLRRFRYLSYLVHLILFSQAFHFMHLGLNVEDDIGNPTSVIQWTSMIKKKSMTVGFSQYVDQFMSKSYQIIYSKVPLRIFPEYKKLLQ
jgi:hypothetical protein